MSFTWYLVQWVVSSFTWNPVLNCLHVVCTHIILCPCRPIPVLFTQAVKDLSLLWCVACTEIGYIHIMIGSQVSLFVRSGGPKGPDVSRPLTEIMQTIELVEGNPTLGNEVSFLTLSCSFQGLLVLTFINFYILESINTIHEVQYHFECIRIEADGPL